MYYTNQLNYRVIKVCVQGGVGLGRGEDGGGGESIQMLY